MAIGDAENACAARFQVGSEDYWKCVQDQHCGANPGILCQGRVLVERVVNPNPVGNQLGLKGLKPETLELARQLAAELQQPGARVSATRTLQLAEALQEAGYPELALQGMEIAKQVETGRAQPRVQIVTRLNDLQAISRTALADRAVGRNLTQ
ncbi:hypothetical protein SE17_23770 [Kouleothrix aurantiaca]|uniref:Uncharacterized protein n=1 Tax=Kouleothrix aurantiaca TaxID=186479 RepID=A0A0P9D6Y4_9CHLR|nr:hypothetical protein SE17_23770 [Kouleothrix aurantiaca]